MTNHLVTETTFKTPLKVREVLRMINQSELLYGFPDAKLSITFTDMEIIQVGEMTKMLRSNYSLTLPAPMTTSYENSISAILSCAGQAKKFFDTPFTYGDIVKKPVAFVDVFKSHVNDTDNQNLKTHCIMLYIPGLAKEIYEKRLEG